MNCPSMWLFNVQWWLGETFAVYGLLGAVTDVFANLLNIYYLFTVLLRLMVVSMDLALNHECFGTSEIEPVGTRFKACKFTIGIAKC